MMTLREAFHHPVTGLLSIGGTLATFAVLASGSLYRVSAMLAFTFGDKIPALPVHTLELVAFGFGGIYLSYKLWRLWQRFERTAGLDTDD